MSYEHLEIGDIVTYMVKNHGFCPAEIVSIHGDQIELSLPIATGADSSAVLHIEGLDGAETPVGEESIVVFDTWDKALSRADLLSIRQRHMITAPNHLRIYSGTYFQRVPRG